MAKNLFLRILSLNLVASLFLFTLPSQGWAMFIPVPDPGAAASADRALIQKMLESKLVQQRIRDLGMNPDEASAGISKLSDEQVHQLATHLDSVQAGGDGLGTLIFLVALAVVIVILLQVSGHRVIIR